MKPAHKILLFSCLILMLLAGAAYFAAGYILYDRLSKVVLNQPERPRNTPDSFVVPYTSFTDFDTKPYLMPGYQSVRIPSRQTGIVLSGWYMEKDPSAPVVILTHGLGSGKFAASILLPAGMLFRQGFNVLVYDMRNHGQSSRDNGRTSIGNKEYLDLLGAWDWLVEKKGISPKRIGLYGLSLGGAAALIAFGEEPRVAALLVDSSFSDLLSVMKEELARNHYPVFLWWPAVVVAKHFCGEDLLGHSPLDAIRNARGRPIMLFHGASDERIAVQHTLLMQQMAQRSGHPVDVWIPQKMKHVDAMFMLTAEYERRLTDFFRKALPGEARAR